jgi:hypothetical protein
MEQNNSSGIEQLKSEAKKKLLLPAIALEFIGIVYFLVITNAEDQTGSTSVHWLIAAVYNSMGKWGGTALFFGLGMFMVILFALKMAKIKKMQ